MSLRACLTGILLALSLPGADKPPLPAETSEFLAWYESYTGPINPADVIRSYEERLTKQGIDENEAKRRIGVVQNSIRSMPDEFTAVHFNKIYGSPNSPFRQEPSQFMARIAADLKPGAALDVAMGQGRNALYLAGKGWNVTGYDLSQCGLDLARASARAAGLKLDTIRASHDAFDYGISRWDLIVETFAFSNLDDAGYRKRIIDSLKPGGILLIEGFGGGSEKNHYIEMFKDLRVVYFEDRDDIADWGMQKSRITRIAVRKD